MHEWEIHAVLCEGTMKTSCMEIVGTVDRLHYLSRVRRVADVLEARVLAQAVADGEIVEVRTDG